MNIEGRERLIEVVKAARGSMSQRAFGRLLGLSSTAIQLWEKGDSIPGTENLAQIAPRAGYTLEELLEYLEGKPMTEPEDVDKILKQISRMPLRHVALIGHAVADRLASVDEEHS